MVKKVLVTGSTGLVGSESVRFYADKGCEVIGIDNDMRAYFFGKEASTSKVRQQLESLNNYKHYSEDIRDKDTIKQIFEEHAPFDLIVHAAAQPSHDWAAKEPQTDFSVNANGTLVLLENTRQFSPNAVFIHLSTNKVYGDTPNKLPIVEKETRFELDSGHKFSEHGIDESMQIDNSKHSLMGASKLSADIMAQEYAKYFGLKTGIFRCGCITGPMHSGAKLHGFLSYLVKCIVQDKEYKILGYKGKQVRDNIHSYDLVNAFEEFSKDPKQGEVYNMGGSRYSNISILEAVDKIEKLSNKKAIITTDDNHRTGDHIWYISDVRKFQKHYPEWKYKYDIDMILKELVKAYEI